MIHAMMQDACKRLSEDDLTVAVEPLGDVLQLERDWCALQAQGQPSFFQSWDWIGSFLACLPGHLAPQVLRVHAAGVPVGLCLLWPGVQRRLRFLRSRVLHLNESGQGQFDRVTLEHNGMLAASGHEAGVVDAAVRHLSQAGGWDEIALGALGAADHARWQAAAGRRGFGYRVRWEKSFHYVDLARIREAGLPYMDALSANTRYQIRRSMRLYAEHGPLLCEHAASADQAQEWLRDLVRLHQARWTAKGEVGAFGSDFALRHHKALVNRAWPTGGVLLTRVRAGERLVGYLYNFVRGGVVSNYQAGLVEEQNSKLKAGLVCHSLAAEDALRRGHRVYDLLMGGAHYKTSLTNAVGTLYWTVLQQRRATFELEELARRGRDIVRRLGRAARADSLDDADVGVPKPTQQPEKPGGAAPQ